VVVDVAGGVVDVVTVYTQGKRSSKQAACQSTCADPTNRIVACGCGKVGAELEGGTGEVRARIHISANHLTISTGGG
jgi:hypothetical protein